MVLSLPFGKKLEVPGTVIAFLCSLALHLLLVIALLWSPFRSSTFKLTGFYGQQIKNNKSVSSSVKVDNRIPKELLEALKTEVVVKTPIKKTEVPKPNIAHETALLLKKAEALKAIKAKKAQKINEKTKVLKAEAPAVEKPLQQAVSAELKEEKVAKVIETAVVKPVENKVIAMKDKEATIEKKKESSVLSKTQEQIQELFSEQGHFSIEVSGQVKPVESPDNEMQALKFAQEVNRLINEQWDPMAGWEDAGPVVIKVSLQKAVDVYREPELVLESKSIAKNQHALNIVRALVRSGAMHGCVFNLTFK